jgi:hypothetical protein
MRQSTSDSLALDERNDINRIAAAHGALNVRVFGSVRRGEASAPVISTCSLTCRRAGACSISSLLAMRCRKLLASTSMSLRRGAFLPISGLGS